MAIAKNSPINSKLSKPAHRALAGAGIKALQQLTKWTEADLLALHGLGPKSIVELREELRENGLAFAAKHAR